MSHVELASEPLDLAAGFERMASFALNGVGARRVCAVADG